MNSQKKVSIDEYIQSFPKEVQTILSKVRKTIQKEAPNATEAIRYAIPTFIQNGNLVHFAAFKKHLGFYSLPSGNLKFQKEIKNYKHGKGSIQFQYDEPIPYDLIRKIVQFRIKENELNVKKKRK
ncbi:Conserved hypothetical protein [Leptospira biflexa serovar Patoc strain 'Patoc 1 (Ames)']|uniref:YdhG-like domain-containing protein n=1 Tax=Leptospira biflexa serovar Patoc (strain Patoc 1 / ATCC 23582 / Paris) TaxID=456481 RepID=B0SRB4_LEPBP|nr:DUF1801 domain-containing protein [Leptospira biflexa]ABZ95695.1 Conserved hypothetical protein [Leptospira biflexa serovar Patoc strain 'Patoc 1 (Ames)']ABZ99406.1 Conserved hypothetical protein [Leptospira biflexa serovar Patoc strain 'Patoc 1 (Paris)']